MSERAFVNETGNYWTGAKLWRVNGRLLLQMLCAKMSRSNDKK